MTPLLANLYDYGKIVANFIMLERVIHNVKEELKCFNELRRKDRFFPNPSAITVGLLTKPEEDINPLMFGLLTAQGSLGLMLDFKRNKGRLSEEKAKRVRAAALLSPYGKYNFQLGEQDMLWLKVAIDNIETHRYLAANIDTMVAFLSFLDDEKRLRYKESSCIKIEGQGNSSMAFKFPYVKQIPKNSVELYTYIKPVKGDRMSKRFGSLKLRLWSN